MNYIMNIAINIRIEFNKIPNIPKILPALRIELSDSILIARL